jgi:hypothetical protein
MGARRNFRMVRPLVKLAKGRGVELDRKGGKKSNDGAGGRGGRRTSEQIIPIRRFPPPRFIEGAPAQLDDPLNATLFSSDHRTFIHAANRHIIMSDYFEIEAHLQEALQYKRQYPESSFRWLDR